jgi:thiamine biosynthesis lipoprotein
MAAETLDGNVGERQTLPDGLERAGTDFVYNFRAMATPCELRIETDDADAALRAGQAAEAEALRIEQKFSRYRDDSVVGRINASGGNEIDVDDETAQLLDFADHCYEISGGMFDITSGVLRRIWRFDGSDKIPSEREIRDVRKSIGWSKVRWQAPGLVLPAGMEIDLGGIGKEYAVDRALAAVRAQTAEPVLINFGGDLAVAGSRKGGRSWSVAIESVDKSGEAAGLLQIAGGALATSGDARRFLQKDGIRYSHILNPRTGRPVMNAPRSVTVAAPTCVEAGTIATLAMLQGKRAEKFLKRERMQAWCIR